VIATTQLAETVTTQQQVIQEQSLQIATLAAEPEQTTPPSINNTSKSMKTLDRFLGRTPHTPTHLFGIEDPLFARGKWWNDLTINRREHAPESMKSTEKDDFQTAFQSYAKGLAERFEQLSELNLLSSLDLAQLAAGNGIIDYSALNTLAGEYIVRRQDAILAYIQTLPSVAGIFPVISNVQNKEIAPTATFGELSQGYRKGRVFKGSASFAAEIYSVADVMFKYEFSDMIRLEKQYIGYLNREASALIKWTFIEWIMVHFATILNNELQRRRVMGVRVPQQSVTANPALFASDGILRAIERAEEELKVLPFVDLGTYTDSTIIDYMESFWDKVEKILPNMVGMKLFINAKHRSMYVKAFRAAYGNDNDFTGVKEGLMDIAPEQIVWVPNMENNCYKCWITYAGNLCNLENKPGEMTAFEFVREMESVVVLSRWKEGAFCEAPGVQYATAVALTASGRKNQLLFTNYPVTKLAADATTVDGSVNTVFETAANTAAKAITDIENASIERVYKIVCGNVTNATTIAQALKFSKLSAAWEPTAVGDYIKVYAELEDYDVTVDGETVKGTRATGKFLELERKVTPGA